MKPSPHEIRFPAGCRITESAHQGQTLSSAGCNCLHPIRSGKGAGPDTRRVTPRFGGLRMLLVGREGCHQTDSPRPIIQQTSIIWRPSGDCVRQHPMGHVCGWSLRLSLGLLGPVPCPHRRCPPIGHCRARIVADYTTARTRAQGKPRSPGSVHRPSHYGTAGCWSRKRGSICMNAAISGLLRAPSSSRARWEHSDQTP